MNIEKYQIHNIEELAQLYTNTVHNINIKDYTKEQIESWAPSKIDYDKWQNRFETTQPYMVKKNNTIVGFFELEDNGHIDCFYVHHNHQGEGVGQLMMTTILKLANDKKLTEVYAEVSITAKPFFEKNGFITEHQNVVVRGEQELVNYTMRKQLVKQ